METHTANERYLYSNESARKALLNWWESLMLSEAELKKKKPPVFPAPTVFKAQLKRCGSIDAAMMTEGFRALLFKLPKPLTAMLNAQDMERWAMIVVALVHVGSTSKFNLATTAGKKNDGDKPVVSELRFSQLRNAKTADEFVQRLRRILQQIKGTVNVIQLAKDIEQWVIEHNNPLPRKADKRISVKWAMDYYNVTGK